MARGFIPLVLLAALVFAAEDKKQSENPRPADPQAAVPEEPPEEDPGLVEKEYAFNPLQAQKEMTVGNFYFKKGSYAAAALRYTEATRWHPTFADAFLRLGETYEKLGQHDKARSAFEQFLAAGPDHKRAGDIKKKLARKSPQPPR